MSSDTIKTENILAIDPGSKKVGLAIIQSDGSIIEKKIIRDFENLKIAIKRLIQLYNPSLVVLGNGTGHSEMRIMLESIISNKIKLETIDERGTSEEARKNYFFQFKPLKRFLITIGYIFGLIRIELDDEVAVIIGKRFLASKPPTKQ